jgi:hypothetical protein
MRSGLVALVLCAALLSPSVNAALTPTRAYAQATPDEATAITSGLAVCTASNVAIGLCVGGLAFVSWYAFYGGDDATTGAIQAAASWFVSWWHGSGDQVAKQQITQQAVAHSSYLYPTAEMVAAWTAPGSVYGGPWVVAGSAATFAQLVGDAGGQTFGWIGQVPDGSSAVGCYHWQPTVQIPGTDAAHRWGGTVYASDDLGQTWYPGQHFYSTNPGNWGPGIAGSCTAAAAGKILVKVVVDAYAGGGAVAGTVDLGPIKYRVTNNVTNIDLYTIAGVMTGNGGANGMGFGAGYIPSTVHLPVAGGSALVGATPATTVPVVGGGTSPLVTPGNDAVANPTGTTTDTGFWEGLFGGVTGGLTSVANSISTLIDGVRGITGLLIQLPVLLVSTIAAAIIPTQGPWSRMGPLIVLANSKAPLGWPSAVFTGFAAIFSGSGSSCPTVTIHTSYFGDRTLTFCPPAGAATVTYILTRVAMLSVVLIWAWNFVNRLLGD